MLFTKTDLPVRLMQRFGAEESLIGDLVEQRRAGRSTVWLYWQVVAAVVLSAARDSRHHPLRIGGSVVAAWSALMLVFIPLGDRLAGGLAWSVWGWTRPVASDAGIWWPFWISAATVSYAGYALAAYVVALSAGRHVASALLVYTASVLVVLLTAAMLVSFAGPIRVWHPLFYVISVGLAYQWRLGFLLVPLTSFVFGVLGTTKRAERVR